jgi:hypothetical protein
MYTVLAIKQLLMFQRSADLPSSGLSSKRNNPASTLNELHNYFSHMLKSITLHSYSYDGALIMSSFVFTLNLKSTMARNTFRQHRCFSLYISVIFNKQAGNILISDSTQIKCYGRGTKRTVGREREVKDRKAKLDAAVLRAVCKMLLRPELFLHLII